MNIPVLTKLLLITVTTFSLCFILNWKLSTIYLQDFHFLLKTVFPQSTFLTLLCSYWNFCFTTTAPITTALCIALQWLVQTMYLGASCVTYRNPVYHDMCVYLIFFCQIATGIPRIAGPFNVARFSSNSVTG